MVLVRITPDLPRFRAYSLVTSFPTSYPPRTVSLSRRIATFLTSVGGNVTVRRFFELDAL